MWSALAITFLVISLIVSNSLAILLNKYYSSISFINRNVLIHLNKYFTIILNAIVTVKVTSWDWAILFVPGFSHPFLDLILDCFWSVSASQHTDPGTNVTN